MTAPGTAATAQQDSPGWAMELRHRANSGVPVGAVPTMARQRRRANLTDRKLAEIATQQRTQMVDLADSTVAGLTARVSPRGTISFYFRWRVDGGGFRRVRLDAANVAEARAKAIESRSATRIGRDPRATQAAYARDRAKTVAETVPDYLASLEGKGRAAGYRRNVERIFEVHVHPVLGRRRIIDLSRSDLAALYRSVSSTKSRKGKGRGGTLTAMANRVHAQVMGLLAWATREGRLPPGAAPVVARPVPEEPSARAMREESKVLLRPEHVATIWCAADAEPPIVRDLVRLLCLLPMRREEITQLAWHEITHVLPGDNVVSASADAFDKPRLDIPADRMKGRRPQVMPLPAEAVSLLRRVHAMRGADGPYVFSVSAGRTAYAGWRKLADRLRARCPNLPGGWVVHDIRGGIASAMGEAGEDEGIIARLLHHAPAARLGVTARYDRSRRLQPMLDALARWEAALLAAVETERRRRVGAIAEIVRLSAGEHG